MIIILERFYFWQIYHFRYCIRIYYCIQIFSFLSNINKSTGQSAFFFDYRFWYGSVLNILQLLFYFFTSRFQFYFLWTFCILCYWILDVFRICVRCTKGTVFIFVIVVHFSSLSYIRSVLEKLILEDQQIHYLSYELEVCRGHYK